MAFLKTPLTLRAVLIGNAVFSCITGLGMAIWSTEIAAVMGLLLHVVLLIVGPALVFYGLFLAWLSIQPLKDRRSIVLACTIADVLWVLGTLGLAVLHPSFLTSTGWIIAIATATVVGVFALFQAFGVLDQRETRHVNR